MVYKIKYILDKLQNVVIFIDPTQIKSEIIINPIDTSYEIICADDLNAPKKA